MQRKLAESRTGGNKEMTEQELREKIAKELCLQDGLDWGWLKEQQRYKGKKDCEYYIRKANSILALFPEWARANGYVKLADDQSLPDALTTTIERHMDGKPERFRQGYIQGRDELLKAGWRKVEVKDGQ